MCVHLSFLNNINAQFNFARTFVPVRVSETCHKARLGPLDGSGPFEASKIIGMSGEDSHQITGRHLVKKHSHWETYSEAWESQCCKSPRWASVGLGVNGRF